MNHQDAQRARFHHVYETIVNRRSVRQFTDEPIDHALLMDMIKAGIYAPSGSNSQNQRFLIIDDPYEIEHLGKHRWVWPWGSNLRKAREREPSALIGRAAAIIIVFSEESPDVTGLKNNMQAGELQIWDKLSIQNCAASIQNILLLSASMGLGSVWISLSDEMSYLRPMSETDLYWVLSKYDIPETCHAQGIIALGHPRKRSKAGFAQGEKTHGIKTSDRETQRASIDSYLIKSVDDPDENNQRKAIRANWKIKFMMFMSSMFYKANRKLRRKIKIETRKAISHEQRKA